MKNKKNAILFLTSSIFFAPTITLLSTSCNKYTIEKASKILDGKTAKLNTNYANFGSPPDYEERKEFPDLLPNNKFKIIVDLKSNFKKLNQELNGYIFVLEELLNDKCIGFFLPVDYLKTINALDASFNNNIEEIENFIKPFTVKTYESEANSFKKIIRYIKGIHFYEDKEKTKEIIDVSLDVYLIINNNKITGKLFYWYKLQKTFIKTWYKMI